MPLRNSGGIWPVDLFEQVWMKNVSSGCLLMQFWQCYQRVSARWLKEQSSSAGACRAAARRALPATSECSSHSPSFFLSAVVGCSRPQKTSASDALTHTHTHTFTGENFKWFLKARWVFKKLKKNAGQQSLTIPAGHILDKCRIAPGHESTR